MSIDRPRAGAGAVRGGGARARRGPGLRLQLREHRVLRRRVDDAARHGPVRLGASARRIPKDAVEREPRLRQSARRRLAARGRDRARLGLRRRYRRPALRAPGRPVRHGLRPRHDRRNARPRTAKRGRGGRATNVHFLKGLIEAIPLPAESMDVVISNCVVNLSTDKRAVYGEIERVLRTGGRLGITDIVAEDRLSPEDRAERGSHVGCIAGALSEEEYREGLLRLVSSTSRWSSPIPWPTECTARSSAHESPRLSSSRRAANASTMRSMSSTAL